MERINVHHKLGDQIEEIPILAEKHHLDGVLYLGDIEKHLPIPEPRPSYSAKCSL